MNMETLWQTNSKKLIEFLPETAETARKNTAKNFILNYFPLYLTTSEAASVDRTSIVTKLPFYSFVFFKTVIL